MVLSGRARLAAALWIVLAIAVWNVIFDYMIVMAGRRYLSVATRAARASGSYVLINDWMRPAIPRALWTATAVAIAIAVVGVGSVVLIVRSRRPSQSSENVSCEPSPTR